MNSGVTRRTRLSAGRPAPAREVRFGGSAAGPAPGAPRRLRREGFRRFRGGWFLLGATTLSLGLAAFSGCRLDMQDQPKYEPLEASDFFGDSQSSRPLVVGTVARGQLREDDPLYLGKIDNALVDTMPFPVTLTVLKRGRQRYNIYCSPCHDPAGYGDGIVVRRGFRRPPSFHIDRLRQAPVGHFYDVISNGFGAMFSYASRLKPRDRWAVVAYIRALQLSQQASLTDVPEKDSERLQSEK
ncbi:MAG: c-type cytochrome [Acidobacteriota bacterium]